MSKENNLIFAPVDLKEGRILTLAAQWKSLNLPKKKAHVINFGYSVKNPGDTTNEELGKIIAEGRASKTPFAQIFVEGERVSKKLVEDAAKLFQEEFQHRFHNYVTAGAKKVKPVKKEVTVTA
jgi:hypothetical protein